MKTCISPEHCTFWQMLKYDQQAFAHHGGCLNLEMHLHLCIIMQTLELEPTQHCLQAQLSMCMQDLSI